MSERPMFYLIDGHAVAYRQYYAMSKTPMSTVDGEPTGAVFGFARMLLDILQKDQPKYLAVSFDQGLSGREKIYPAYKAQRPEMEPDMVTQLGRIHELVQAFNIPIFELEDYEADDIIGTIAQQAEAQGVDVRIITGDKDMLQLLTEHVTVLMARRAPNEADRLYDLAAFKAEFGIELDQYVDFKALKGDTSDNIPGVKGVGDKTATQLLQAYGTLENIYANISLIKGALQQKLIAGRENAFLSQKLSAIMRDVPLVLNLPACVAHDYDHAQVERLFYALQFRSLLKRLEKPNADSAATALDEDSAPASAGGEEGEGAGYSEFAPPPIYAEAKAITTVIVRDQATLDAMVKVLENADAIAFDTETTSVDPMTTELVGISLSVDGETGYYIPVGHRGAGAGMMFAEPVEQLPLQTVIDAIRPALTNPQIAKYAHHADFDMIVLGRYGIEVTPITFDTMIGEWVVEPGSKFLGLKPMAKVYLGAEMQEISTLIGTGKKQITMAEVPVERAAPYAAADAGMTYQLVPVVRKRLEEAKLTTLFETLEMPLVPVIIAMERAGVALDVDSLRQMSVELEKQLKTIEADIYEKVGMEFNINSPKQLNDVLFNKLGLSAEGLRKTSHGFTTNVNTLESLVDKHPAISRIMEHREVSKLKSTYVDALPALINPQTGRVHTSYHQTGAITGRLSSSNPNLQNIPIRTEARREVRAAFIAPAGSRLLSVDYSQIELRVMAHISEDDALLDAFRQGQDIHKATAALVYGVPLESVTYEQRSFAKRVNFGLIYGMGAFRLARDSNLTLAEAQDFIKTYFERLPGVKRYMDETKRKASEEGYLYTLFGRRGNFMALTRGNTNFNTRQALERAAINMPIQGTAADIMKKAMIDMFHALKQHNSRARMILQVHDELVLEVPEDEVQSVRDLVVNVMENAYSLKAPLKANAQVGVNWRNMEAI